MLAVAAVMFKGRRAVGVESGQCNRGNIGKVISFGFGTGVFSGFLGIGGVFLIVPGLVAPTSMPILRAIGTSLVAVAAFGLTTVFSHAASGLVIWPLALAFIAGGGVGSLLGTATGRRMSADKDKLNGFRLLRRHCRHLHVIS